MTSPPSAERRHGADLDELVRTHQAMVWRYLRFLGCSADEADDLTQETFLAVLDRPLRQFGAAGARAYLRRVARNAFLKRRERAGRRPEVDLDTADAAYDWFRGDDEGARVLAALDACLAGLSAQAQQALALRFAERLDRRTLAMRLGVGPHGVKSLLQRSYARLRACIERRLRDAEA